jgi:hypothetical protein
VSGLLLSACNFSRILSVFACFGVTVYIAVAISPAGFGYCLAALLLGILAGWALDILFAPLLWLGDIAGTFMALLAGPTSWLAAWLFYQNKLLRIVEQLIDEGLRKF